MAMIETGIPLTARTDFRDAQLPIVPRGGQARILSTVQFNSFTLVNDKTQVAAAPQSILPTCLFSLTIQATRPCNPFHIWTDQGKTASFQVVMPCENIAYIDTYMTGGADYNIGGTDYPHRIYFYLASLQIDTAEKVTKYDDERGTVIPLSATNFTTYTLQTINTDAFTLEKLMKISNNDHITLHYTDANGNSQSVNLIRTTEAPSIERYPKMSSGSFSCKFVKA